jgi:hypothetical protein
MYKPDGLAGVFVVYLFAVENLRGFLMIFVWFSFLFLLNEYLLQLFVFVFVFDELVLAL